MQLRRLQATFGKLEGDTLVLAPGLNCIQAPNESGKSTWCAFLRAMLYGLPSRARGPLADKNRYAPWSGRAMEGLMELTSDLGDLTITRRTLRPASPMGEFRAVYTGTATAVPEMTAAACGEQLTGVPAGVFARSAFISQSALPISQDAELERRIAALVTTGEEDTSYTEGAGRLQKYLRRLRYHKTGQLPRLEQELAALQAAQETVQTLTAQLEALRDRQTSLEQQVQTLTARLRQRRQASLERLADAEAAVQALEETLASLPAREALLQLQAALADFAQQAGPCAAAGQRAEAARRELDDAQEALGAFPSSAEPIPAASRRFPWIAALAAALSLAAAWVLLALGPSPLLSLPAFLLGAALLVVSGRRFRRLKRQTEADAAQRRALSDHRQAAENRVEAARQAAQSAAAAYDALRAALAEREQQLLRQARAFAPQAADLAGAGRAADAALEQYRRWDLARQQAERLRLRCASADGVSPEEPGEDLLTSLHQAQEQLGQLGSQEQYLLGRIQALEGDGSLPAAIEDLQARRDRLQGDYDAARLALEALEQANTQLQTRFSPALGKISAKIFAKLTEGTYNKVFLSQALDVAAGQPDSAVPREAALLSQGTADQLYLAVRLAICQLVLPADKRVPLVLDDALSHFDDRRMAAALDYLVSCAGERQILLFTCQSRELDYLEKAHPGAFHAVSLP